MKVITLLTDWGSKDYYVASLKGNLLRMCQEVSIIDISHEINHFDIVQASFMLGNCYEKFPDGSVHLIAVRRSSRQDQSHGYVLVKCHNQFFLGYDSGIFYLTLGDEPKEIFKLNIDQFLPQYIAIHKLCLISSALINGEDYKSLGTPVEEIQKVILPIPVSDHNSIRGTVIHVDSFHNVFLNVKKDVFEKVGKNRPFTLLIRREPHRFNKVHRNYDDVRENEIAILFDEKGHLFIALNRSPAANLLGLEVNDVVRIDFEG